MSLPQNDNCGFGVVIADDAVGASRFSKAINVIPVGISLAEKPSEGTFTSLECWTDDRNARALTGGSATAADMTFSKCAVLAKGFRFAGVEYST